MIDPMTKAELHADAIASWREVAQAAIARAERAERVVALARAFADAWHDAHDAAWGSPEAYETAFKRLERARVALFAALEEQG